MTDLTALLRRAAAAVEVPPPPTWGLPVRTGGNGRRMSGSSVIAVAVDCQDAERLAEFWCAALGTEVDRRWSDAHGVGYVQIGTGGGPVLLFQPVPDGKTGKNRLHLDIAPRTGSQDDEVERLVRLGASRVADEQEHPWVVLADPEGNEFCVLPPHEN